MNEVLRPFDYRGVALLAGRWHDQYQAARDFYVRLSEDDVLHGFRKLAGLPAPGQGLTGWCREDSSVVFGQWLSGLARMAAATGDEEAAAKAIRLRHGWAEAWRAGPRGAVYHYPFDKLVGGLVDLAHYVGDTDSNGLLREVTIEAADALDRRNVSAAAWPPELADGDELEWYTLSENLLRAHELASDSVFRELADAWLYPQYWNKFVETTAPIDAYGVHAYSHLNTFNGAAMAFKITGEARYLAIIRNAFDWFQTTQCYATGGFGPAERLLPADGRLGYALESRPDSFEAPCGSWAAFKLSRYLMQFTGEARYGDWIERLVYNGVGAALPIIDGGRHFYYADYRVGGGVKVYHRDTYACCSGSYAQAVADYYDLIFLRDAETLYVNLYLPSEVTWDGPDGVVQIRQTTSYPEGEEVELRVGIDRPSMFGLAFRVPGWAHGLGVEINGERAEVAAEPGTWARLRRTWAPDDRITVRIPLRFRAEPVDEQHPNRVAFLRGPAVVVFDASCHEPFPDLPADLEGYLFPDDAEPGSWRLPTWRGRELQLRARPFYALGESHHYRMYLDLDRPPVVLW